jgi:hypothetical protein
MVTVYLNKKGTQFAATHRVATKVIEKLVMTEQTTCTICGVTSVCWVEKKLGQPVTIRDYMPTTVVFRLKPQTTSSFIVLPEIKRMAVHYDP